MFIGRMYGVSGTNKLIQNVTSSIAQKVAKDLLKASLTKTMWYPIIKELGKQVGIKITKDVVSKSAAKSIPVISSVISGGLTYYSFDKGAEKLHYSLKTAPCK